MMMFRVEVIDGYEYPSHKPIVREEIVNLDHVVLLNRDRDAVELSTGESLRLTADSFRSLYAFSAKYIERSIR